MPSFRLDSLRIASPCHERWAEMTGDERARHCKSCDKDVFNLSEMTRDAAEALLSARGVKPCVRFYQRSDGTIVTADCSPRARRSRKLTVIAAGVLSSSTALADPDPTTDGPPGETAPAETDPNTPADTVPVESVFRDDITVTMGVISYIEPEARRGIEWSTWMRAGYGMALQPSALVARTTTPLPPEPVGVGEAALGLDVSIAISHRVRLGAWSEWRTVSEPVLGGELIAGTLPRHPNGGSMGLVLRGGGNRDVITGAIGFGYTAVDPWLGHHHATNVRGVASINRAVDDPRNWSLTFGLEFDPIGAIGRLVKR